MPANEVLASRKDALDAFLQLESEKLESRDPSYLSPSILESKMELAFIEGWLQCEKLLSHPNPPRPQE